MNIRLSSGNRASVAMKLGETALVARYAQEAKEASESAKAASSHPPIIGGNGNWQIWNQGSGAYVDSGLCALGPAGEQGPQGEAGNYTKPAAGIPEEDLSQAVRNKLNRGGTSDYVDLNNKPGINDVTLSGNKTAAQLGLAAADDVPTKTSQLQNDVGFLTQHQSLAAYRTSAAQDAIDANLMALGLTGAVVGDLARVAAVDASGKPTSWNHVPLCDITTNPNLLDNWYFVGGGSQQGGGQFPINQQELTIYSAPGNIFDRWIFRNTGISASILPDYIKIDFPSNLLNFAQRVNLEAGRLYTLSILTDSGLIYGTGAPSASENTEIFRRGNFAYRFWDNIGIMVTSLVADATINIKAIKLEAGTEQTLAHQEGGVWVLNELPNYFDELAKCQKHFVRYKTGPYLFNAITAANGANLEFSLPIFMKRGTIKVSGSPEFTLRVAGTQRFASQYVSAVQGQLGEINLTYALTEQGPANESGAAWVNSGYLDVFINKEA